MQKLENFTTLVLERFSAEITDNVFLLIQNDHNLMASYLSLVQEKGVLAVNTTIGKAIKSKYALANQNARQVNPKSTLIKSHQIFE